MVRTSGGIRISAGKSSKKGGGAASRSAPSTPSGKTGSSGSKGSSRLPPIPHCEAPSWQKPITNFFNAGVSSSKDDPQIIEQPEENLENIDIETENKHNKGESSTLVNKINGNLDIIQETNHPDGIKKDKAVTENKIEHLNNMDDNEPQIKRQKEEQDKENEDSNST